MSDTPIPYKRDSSAASVSAGDVYRVGLLIKHAASCECCRNAIIEDEEDNNNIDETKAWLAHQASQQPEALPNTTQPAKSGREHDSG